MRTRLFVIAAIAACAASTAFAQEPGTIPGRWAEDFTAGDMNRALALYHENATFVGLGSREIGRDREAARAYLSAVFNASSERQVTCDSPLVRQRGDATVVAGVCQFSIAFKDGRKLNSPVRYHMVVQKIGPNHVITDHHLSLVPGQ